MTRSVSEYAEELDRLTCGFIKPVFEKRCPRTGRLLQAGLAPEDFERVRLGYACPECLTKFRVYLVRCPACGHQRDLGKDLQDHVPQEWKDHLETRRQALEGELPSLPLVSSMDEVLRRAHQDPDIERIPLSKLRRRRRP